MPPSSSNRRGQISLAALAILTVTLAAAMGLLRHTLLNLKSGQALYRAAAKDAVLLNAPSLARARGEDGEFQFGDTLCAARFQRGAGQFIRLEQLRLAYPEQPHWPLWRGLRIGYDKTQLLIFDYAEASP